MAILEIKDLHAEIEGKEILKGVNLKIDLGKVNALMGPNGCGKSTLSHVIMGNLVYTVTSGNILFNGEDITQLEPHERARKGVFMSFQYPKEIAGVTISNFLRTALNNLRGEKIGLLDFKKLMDEKMGILKMDQKFLTRYLNEGFSGGEKKKAEILQMLVLNPTLAILDETDSGLDIDSIRTVSEGVNSFMSEQKGILIITHYKRILEYIKPDFVYIMKDGKIVHSGSGDLIDELEEKGYGWVEG